MRKQAVPSLDFIFCFTPLSVMMSVLLMARTIQKQTKAAHITICSAYFQHFPTRNIRQLQHVNVGMWDFSSAESFQGTSGQDLTMLWLSHTREKIGQQPSWQLEKLVVVLGLHYLFIYFLILIYFFWLSTVSSWCLHMSLERCTMTLCVNGLNQNSEFSVS